MLLSGGRYVSLAGHVEITGAAILFGDVRDDGKECDDNYVTQAVIIMREREKVTRSVQKTLRWIFIVVLKWTLLTLDSVGEGKTKCKKFYTHSAQMVKYSAENYSGLLAEQGKLLRLSMH